MDQPRRDSRFSSFFLDPALARVVNALTGGAVAIPPPPRIDLLPVVQYLPPIAAPGTPPGPIADLLRLNTGVPPTPPESASRLGLLGGDLAGFPNGRRVFDDVTDITLRLVVGGVLAGPPFSDSPINTRLGDGVNVNDAPYRATFPYLAYAPSGRDRRHIDPGEPPGGVPGGFEFVPVGSVGARPADVAPAGATVWRVNNPEIGHIDGPYSLSDESPCVVPDPTTGLCSTTSIGGVWADTDICPIIHLHLPAAGHGDPAPGPPSTISACGHGGLEWGMLVPTTE
jgi:hypothetical protein